MKEIERKFLVTGDSYRDTATEAVDIRQGYLSTDPDATVRVRLWGREAYITVKGRNRGAVRDEWEYPVPLDDALAMLDTCCGRRVLHKTRYIVPFDGRMWEVDEFHGSLEGLRVAEIELPDADAAFALPPFVGDEVTDNPDYYNSTIASRL